jgi:RES domain
MIPPPPSPFFSIPDSQIGSLKPGSVFHRVHAATFKGDEFNPCRGDASRFAPIYDPDCVASLYAGSTFKCAAFETVFHNIPPAAAFKTIKKADLLTRAHSEIEILSPLRLVQLHEPDLNRWRLTRSQLIDTPASAYTETARWAEAIHRARNDVQGLIWTSKRCDPDRSILLFGSRVRSGRDIRGGASRIADDPSPLLDEFQGLAGAYDITITL